MGQITRSRFGVDPFGAPPRTVVRRSQEINLNVQPIPASFSGNQWLPAENLTIAEEWSDDPMTLRVGEPITRTLIMSARGLISSQLPELPDWSVGDLKFYPDRPQLEDEMSDAGVYSTRREQAAIIPNQPGSYVLPEIAIPWWNIQTDQQEIAVVPERTIRVLSATGVDTGQPDITSLVAPIQPILNGPAEDEVEITPRESPPVTDESQSDMWKWSTLLIAIVWVITLVVWWKKSTGAKHSQNTQYKSAAKIAVGPAENNVIAACENNDPLKAKNALLEWAGAQWAHSAPVGLGEIAARTGGDMRDQINHLNRVLYSSQMIEWDGAKFKSVFSDAVAVLKQKHSRPEPEGQLQPLHKL
jgi:hypothetical protein